MSYIGNVPTTAAFPFSQFSGNGSTTAFTLTSAPAGSTAILVYVAGVVQNPNVYSVVSNTLTFNVAPAVGTNNIGVLYLGIPAYTTALGSFTSAQLAAALTDETGTGLAVFNTSPTLVTPALGTPSALVGTNITGTAASLTAGNATTAAAATTLATANFSVVQSGSKLYFKYGATNIASMDSTGNFISLLNVTAYGTP